jgi:hypothetical protein
MSSFKKSEIKNHPVQVAAVAPVAQVVHHHFLVYPHHHMNMKKRKSRR